MAFAHLALGILTVAAAPATAAVPAAPATAADGAGAVELTGRWDFSREEDRNYNDWPDGWQRRSGRAYPRYQKIEITSVDPQLAERARAVDAELLGYWRLARAMPYLGPRLAVLPPTLSDALVGRYLRATLDGGGVWVQSPAVEVNSAFSYQLVARMTTEGLENDASWLELAFFDGDGNLLERVATERLKHSSPWQAVSVGPTAAPADAESVAVRFRVEPDGRADISGHVGVDAIRLFRMPQMSMRSDQPEGLYAVGESVEVTCLLSGLVQPDLEVRFELTDHAGEVLREEVVPVKSKPVVTSGGALSTGSATWQLPPMPAGFYRASASIEEAGRTPLEARRTFAVLGKLPMATGSPFGWSLAAGHAEVPRRRLPTWLTATRVGWVKYPCWLPPNDTPTSDELAWLLERLQDIGIQPVGVLDQPPAAVRDLFPGEGPLPAAQLFHENATWQPLLEPQMTRLSMKLTWWQLGADRDYSFLGRTGMVKQLDAIRRGLQGYGQALDIALPWPWLEPLPEGVADGWRAECLETENPLTADELDRYLEARAAAGGRATWLLLDPLPPEAYSLETRVRDLVERMVAVRRHDVAAAFVSDPFDPRRGLLRPDGTPDALLLPWRTTAALVGPLRHAGRLELPSGSDNALLSNGSRAVLVVWNMNPVEEELYLGDQPEQIDVWGRRTPLGETRRGQFKRQRVAVGPWPTFIVGVDPRVAQWRQGLDVAPSRLDSILGRPQEMTVTIRNPLERSISGVATVRAPETWQATPRAQRFQVEAGGTTELPLTIRLRRDATTGTTPLRIDLEVESGRSDHFSVWRDVDVGPADVEFELVGHLDEQGNYVVRQEVVNLGDQPQRFDCHMITGIRERQRTQLVVQPGKRVTRTYSWPNGDELVGRIVWLQAIELGGDRVLNYRLTAER